MTCMLELPGVAPLQGQTRELSEREASIQCPNLAVPNIRKPKAGLTGVLTLSGGASSQREPIKIPCRVAHLIGNVIGLQLNPMGISAKQKERFAALLGLRA